MRQAIRALAWPRVGGRIRIGSFFIGWHDWQSFRFGRLLPGAMDAEWEEDSGVWVFVYSPATIEGWEVPEGFSVKARRWGAIRRGFFAFDHEVWTRKLSPRLAAEIGEHKARIAARQTERGERAAYWAALEARADAPEQDAPQAA
ncbi:hypothetical protein [Lichenibacterium ramalinae]|uniref:Uncharacterized protein n=1 Tax=Lichenibacterium ramalinae TaxID=2316527 RepID=A0A4Q2R8B9_9HYPH|nr:hypothetical protein [Lichenibacterium ramalinae]RYB03060.1 hypothetical protein D3272_18495 [Lichenibacterium ramalinae]